MRVSEQKECFCGTQRMRIARSKEFTKLGVFLAEDGSRVGFRNLTQRMSITRFKGSTRLGASVSEERIGAGLRNVVFFIWTMDKAQKMRLRQSVSLRQLRLSNMLLRVLK